MLRSEDLRVVNNVAARSHSEYCHFLLTPESFEQLSQLEGQLEGNPVVLTLTYERFSGARGTRIRKIRRPDKIMASKAKVIEVIRDGDELIVKAEFLNIGALRGTVTRFSFNPKRTEEFGGIGIPRLPEYT